MLELIFSILFVGLIYLAIFMHKRVTFLFNENQFLSKKISDIEIDSFKKSDENIQLRQKLRETDDKVTELLGQLEQENNKTTEVISQKKASETRLGQISEHLVPFLTNCPFDPKSMHFFGQPVDYLVFDYDQGEIIFLEIKSGNSKPSKRQKLIKNIIKTGRVYYSEIRIDQKGVKYKKVENNE